MSSHGLEQVTEPLAEHGEGPVWHDAWGGLRWVDMLRGDLWWLSPEGPVRHRVGTVAAAVRPRWNGGAVVALERGFALLDDDALASGGEPVQLGELWTDPSVRFNDGGCDPDGRFYCGSLSEEPGQGSLYRLDADGQVATVLDKVTVSNGLAWSPDGHTAYYIDTATARVDAFDYHRDTGLTGRRPVVRIDEAAGGPDGMTVDAEGNLWVAMWGGSAVRCFAPHGALLDVIELPVTQVTACTFGGPDLATLYITTSQLGADVSEQPEAGAVFRAEPGVRGLPVLRYAG